MEEFSSMDNNELKNEIEKIKKRNEKVELNKAWETSWTRKLCICILTYIVVVIYSFLINKINNIAAGARQQNTNSPLPFLSFIGSSPIL